MRKAGWTALAFFAALTLLLGLALSLAIDGPGPSLGALSAWGSALGVPFITVVTGTFVYAAGQLFSKLVLEPAQEVRKLIGEVDLALTMHARLIGNLGAEHFIDLNDRVWQQREPASETLRELAAKLRASSQVVTRYDLAVRSGILPPRQRIREASAELIGLSNMLGGWRADDFDNAHRALEKTRQLLGLDYNVDVLALFEERLQRPDSSD